VWVLCKKERLCFYSGSGERNVQKEKQTERRKTDRNRAEEARKTDSGNEKQTEQKNEEIKLESKDFSCVCGSLITNQHHQGKSRNVHTWFQRLP
jgi:hypothetical protein